MRFGVILLEGGGRTRQRFNASLPALLVLCSLFVAPLLLASLITPALAAEGKDGKGTTSSQECSF